MYEGAEVCYTISDVVMTWQKAFDYCRSLPPDGGVLAAVYNVDIQNRLAKVLENVTSPLWIAGKTEDPELLEGNIVSQWRWVYGRLAVTLYCLLFWIHVYISEPRNSSYNV